VTKLELVISEYEYGKNDFSFVSCGWNYEWVAGL